MAEKLPPLPSGAEMMPPLPAGAEMGTPTDSGPSFLDRIKNLVITPKNQRDQSLGESVSKAFSPAEILQSMGHEAYESLKNVPGDIYPNTPEKLEHAFNNPLGPAGAVGMDILGAAASPLTGLANNLSRPIEYETGIRREIPGAALSLIAPLGDIADASNAARSAKLAETVKPMAETARKEGYVLAPHMLNERPGLLADTLGGWSGKIKTQQAASARNQEITNKLANKALGLPEDATLTPQQFSDVRTKAGKAYDVVKKTVPEINADPEYDSIVSSLGGSNSHAAQHFPGITKNQAILDLANELKTVKTFPTEAGVEVVKELRSSATANLKAIGDPSKHALGLAQREAAEAIDDLMDRNIQATGNKDAIKNYREARKLIAKSHDIEGATNAATGDVNALGIARLGAKGKPLTEELKTISDVANAFPKAMQAESSFGGTEALSGLDFFGSALALAHGNPEVAGAIMGRPLGRKMLLSEGVQDRLAGLKPNSPSVLHYLQTPSVLQGGNVLAGNQGQ